MKTLFGPQQRVADKFLKRLLSGRNTLDSSDLGTGKTVVAGWVAARYLTMNPGSRIAVVCPKAAIVHWERELAESGIDEPLFVLNYEKLRAGNTPWCRKWGKKMIKWDLPPSTLVLMDEVHMAKAPYTFNAQLLIGLVRQKVRVHCMSATAAENPTEMRALGYVLGLHSLNGSGGTTAPNWFRWMRSHGCYQNEWRAWSFEGRPDALRPLHATLYGGSESPAARVAVADMPSAFRNNRVVVDPMAFSALDKIQKAYEDLGITPAILDRLFEQGDISDEQTDNVLTALLRARQLAEALKVPDLVPVVMDLVAQGRSIVAFVNFDESRIALQAALGCQAVYGGQSAKERQEAIDSFQADRCRVLVVNSQAGGAAISLHDTHGKHPRVSLISPSFSAVTFRQVLGRIYRNGAKSDAVQRVLVAPGSVEEHVVKVIRRKLANLDALHGSESPDLSQSQSQKP